MKVLVIPDVHLKPWIFKRAAELMRNKAAEVAVCLMDIADDWDRQFNIELYAETYDEAMAFAEEFPETLWCYGNHDLSYLWEKLESGYSVYAHDTVCRKMKEFRERLPEAERLAYLHVIDNTLFSHGGLADDFAH